MVEVLNCEPAVQCIDNVLRVCIYWVCVWREGKGGQTKALCVKVFYPSGKLERLGYKQCSQH